MPLDEKQLAEALRTGKAVTRDGRAVTGLHRFDADGICLYGVINRSVFHWYINGIFVKGCESPAELFPYVEPKPVIERWVNVYLAGEAFLHQSKEQADRRPRTDRFGQIHFTYNPDKPFGQRVTVEEIALEESK